MHGPFEPSEDQALATVEHAAEEIRFFKGQQWHVANYALLAYAALAAAPSWMEAASWRCWASGVAVVLVFGAFLAALWVLLNLEVSIEKERRRLHAARHDLPLMRDIHNAYRLEKIRSEMWWRPSFGRRAPEWGTDRTPCVPRLFVAVLVGGFIVASAISVSSAIHTCSELSPERDAWLSWSGRLHVTPPAQR